MSNPDTRPSEYAEIIEDERKFRAWAFVKIQKIEMRLDSQESSVKGAVSGVNILEGDKKLVKGMWLGIAWVASIGAALATAAAWVWDHLSKGSP
jgi:hypothetical protein